MPADGYYEWKQGTGKAKQPYYVHPGEGSGLVFAGLYEWWKDPSKAEGEPGRWMLSTSILTADTPPPGAESTVFGKLTALHDRVPLPMDRATMASWIDPQIDDAAFLVDLVRAHVKDVAADWHVDSVGRKWETCATIPRSSSGPVEALF